MSSLHSFFAVGSDISIIMTHSSFLAFLKHVSKDGTIPSSFSIILSVQYLNHPEESVVSLYTGVLLGSVHFARSYKLFF